MTLKKYLQLDHYRLLGHSGLRVSPLCLGTMTFGTEWGWGANKEESQKVFNHYAERGGNFVDTANFYTNGTSESWLGEFMSGRRDQFVLSTKYSLYLRKGDPNACGNHRKCLVQSLEGSLKRLKTDYIDLYWVHAWDALTPIEEVMRALDDVVRVGKVLYVGISDAPAWKVAQANTIAQLRGWSPFIALQIKYNLAERTVERELVPMAREMGIGVCPWSPLEGGLLTGKYNPINPKEMKSAVEEGGRSSNIKHKLSKKNLQISEAVQVVGTEIARSPSEVALNWLLQQPGVSSIVIGARTVRQFTENLGCLNFQLRPEQVRHLDEVSAIDLGFPHNFLANEAIQMNVTGGASVQRPK